MACIYLHMGYPKCLSTTIQRSFFEKHPDIWFAGVGIGNNISYADEAIEFCFESLLKYANRSFWEKEKRNAKIAIDAFVEQANGRKVVFSSEYLVMNLVLQGIDNAEKLERIAYLFSGYTIKVLLIRRKIEDLLTSLYKEFVRLGYTQSFQYFLQWVIVYKDRNFVSDLNYDLKEAQIIKYLPSANITWLYFSEIQKMGFEMGINRLLSEWLDIRNEGLEVSNDNPSLSDAEVEKLLDINNRYPRNISSSQMESFEKHRNRILYKQANLGFEETYIFSNILEKRKAMDQLIKWPEPLIRQNEYRQPDLMNRVRDCVNSFSE